jgi:hypothetical protein
LEALLSWLAALAQQHERPIPDEGCCTLHPSPRRMDTLRNSDARIV